MKWYHVLGILFILCLAGIVIISGLNALYSAEPNPEVTYAPPDWLPVTGSTPTRITPPVFTHNMTVTYINVGQGDSEWIVSPTGKTMLIDAGDNVDAKEIIDAIGETTNLRDTNYIDHLVATHSHADHIAGMETLMKKYGVGNFIDSGYATTSKVYENMLLTIDEKGLPYTVVKKGDYIDFDNAVNVTVLNPQASYLTSVNDNSIVLLMRYKNVSFLFAGDSERNAESIYARDISHVNVLKVGHHGGSTSTYAYLISKTHPNVSVISVGKGNQYGHPDEYTVTRLEKDGSLVYRTDKDGTITITTDGEQYSVITEKT